MSNIGGVTQGVVNAPAANSAPVTPKKAEVEAPAPQTSAASSSGAATVQLSNAAQALLLQQQGLTAAQISHKLGISISKVNGYLASGTNTNTTTAVAATPKASGTT
ncbi:hypothetical protein [Candidatus Magnetominusculus dajiuhuensis]|uniref:hypothetical protein n=1 Tax=Candidatus Magnetominusculus dajiuhuensis TaxID=3137712 RepID=UPI003B42A248